MTAKTKTRSGTYSLRTLWLAVSSCAVACSLLTWESLRPAVMPVVVAIPVFWCGSLCMTLGSRRFLDHHAMLLLGCVLMSVSVLVGVVGSLFVALLWWASSPA